MCKIGSPLLSFLSCSLCTLLQLIENNILTQLEMEMIFEMYMPVLLSYAVHSAINNQYKESTKILELIKLFWKEEYKILKNGDEI